MNPLFHPRLVNGPLGDPVLYIDFKFAQRAVLFDLGEIQSLSPRQILKISQVFISHTHMDHFIGFDHLLRICLGRDKVIELFGPPGFMDQLEHKLSAYTWNLVENYPYSLELKVVEVYPDHVRSGRLRSSTAFKLEKDPEIRNFDGELHRETSFRIEAAFLDHKIPCLAFVLKEHSHINIIKTELEGMGLSKGPWLRELKEAVWRGEADDFPVKAPSQGRERVLEPELPLGLLRSRLITVTPGQKIGYVADTVYNPETRKAIIDLVSDSDLLFMETAFLEEDAKRARAKNHLTAHQAGIMAAQARVKRLVPFHISPKYSLNPERVIEEALGAFREGLGEGKLVF
jgi:ribonuclease Z